MLIKQLTRFFFVYLIIIGGTGVFGQNETKKWYFGNQAGLDFMTAPPTPIIGSAISTSEGCASIADATGNILFYTDGVTVYNQTNAMMANGNSLLGFSSSSQSAVIVKQPGNNNIYYIFTQGAITNGTRYSIVDMNLSAGQGSVTVKNATLQIPSSEKLTSVKHCNGVDFWILSHDPLNNTFRSYSLTAAGVNTAAVVSNVGTTYIGADYIGILKISPNGRKIGSSLYGTTAAYEIFDFDPATGVVSNPLLLGSSLNVAYGCEFSSDGSKFYGTRYSSPYVYQWDLCAGSPAAIAASMYTVNSSGNGKGALQLAPDGKIYIARAGSPTLAVINNPNVGGAGCNYVELGQVVSPGSSNYGLPNFITSLFNPVIPPFTYTINPSPVACLTVSFTAPSNFGNPVLACGANGYSVIGLSWNFGDPSSGAFNTSSLYNPTHAYSGVGTYTAQLTIYFSCGAVPLTLSQTFVINQPCISIGSTSITCASLGSATVLTTGGTGPYSYTWMPGGQTTSVVSGLNPGSYTINVLDVGTNLTYTALTVFNSLVPFVGLLDNSPNVSCPGANTGTAAIALFGGSGNQYYYWNNGLTTQTTPTVNNLGAGIHTIVVVDALTSCSVTQNFFIMQPPLFNLTISTSSPSVCIGSGISFTAANSGGNAGSGYTYTWTGGPTNTTHSVAELVAGNYVYTVSSKDASNCAVSNTIGVAFVPNPTVTVSNSSICPLQTGTLIAGGASTYTWNGTITGNTLTGNPIMSTQYSVIGTALGCTAAATASIILKPIPSVTVSQNAAICESGTYTFSATGGNSYGWMGPQGFTSMSQSNTLTPLQLNDAGVYQVTVTAFNTCTAVASTTLMVNPLPSISVSPNNPSICFIDGNVSLTVNGTATLFSWSPSPGLSTLDAQITNASPSVTTIYSVVGSLNTCTAMATSTVNVIQPPNLAITLSSSSICAQGLNNSPNILSLTAGGAASYTIVTPGTISNSNPSGPLSQLAMLPPYSSLGLITTTLYGSNGVCTSSLTNTFVIIPNPVIVLSNPSQVICMGQSHTFLASGADNYYWSSQIAGVISYINVNQAVLSPTTTTLFSVIGSSLGCNSITQTGTVTVNPLPQILINPVSTVCIGSSVDLFANGTGVTFTWSPSFWLNTSNSASVIANPPVTQNYMVLASLNACTQSALVTVSVLPLPIPTIIAFSPTLCANENILLTGQGGGTYSWDGPLGYSSKQQSVTIPAYSSSYGGFYTLTVTDNNLCKNVVQQKITVYDLPTGYLSSDHLSGCVPFCSELILKQAPGATPLLDVNWLMGVFTFTGSTFSHCFNEPGNYKIYGTLSDTNNCRNTIFNSVDAYPLPIADFSFLPENPRELMDDVVFTNTSKGDQLSNWNWFFIENGGYQSTSQHTSYSFEKSGIYPVAMVVKNVWGCSDTVVKTIAVMDGFSVFVPNVFTPNQDGLNDVFFPVARGILAYNITVLDRWGEQVFKSDELTYGWDGVYKEKPVKEDTYVWQIKVKTLKGDEKVLNGHVTVQR